jgi:hypothetical protein
MLLTASLLLLMVTPYFVLGTWILFAEAAQTTKARVAVPMMAIIVLVLAGDNLGTGRLFEIFEDVLSLLTVAIIGGCGWRNLKEAAGLLKFHSRLGIALAIYALILFFGQT